MIVIRLAVTFSQFYCHIYTNTGVITGSIVAPTPSPKGK